MADTRFRRTLTKMAVRAGSFLGVTDLTRSVEGAQRRLDTTDAELTDLRDELRRRVQMLEEEQLRLQNARAVWTTTAYLASTPITEKELVTVVLPTRNRAALLQRAVESVLAQSYRNWELVVVVDGPDDDTAHVMRGFDDTRIEVISQEHTGPAGARNAALDKASGHYVVYLDDDNIMHEHWLRGVAWAFSRHAGAQLMIGARLIDDEYRGRGLERGGPPHLSFRHVIDRGALAESNQADLMQVAHRRDLRQRFDRDDEPYEDWGFLARAVRDHDPLCFPALAGIYTTTAPGRLMDGAELDRRADAVRRKLR